MQRLGVHQTEQGVSAGVSVERKGASFTSDGMEAAANAISVQDANLSQNGDIKL